MARSYIAVDALTGKPWGDLPAVTIDDASSTIGNSATATGTYPIASDQTPQDWLLGTVPWGVAILLVSDDASDPLNGWYINRRVRTEGDTMSLSLVTAEEYFNRRYVGTVTYTGLDQNTICTSLVTSYVIAPPAGASGLSGLPMTTNVVGAAGTARTRAYSDSNDQTVMAALQELMGVQGGPEWSVTWKHLTSPERYFPQFNVGTRLGSS